MALKYIPLIFIVIFFNCTAAHNVQDASQHIKEGEAGHHDATYDHEAFLGADQAKEFDQLTPDQSKIRLKAMLPKIDKDGDGKIIAEELKQHIRYMARKYVDDDITRTWNYHGMEKDASGKLDWERYRKSTTGVEMGQKLEPEYQESIDKDQARWPHADINKDGLLNFDEYRCFQHPETCKIMRPIMVQESFDMYDKNKDGFVSFEEFVSDVYMSPEETKDGKEPDWMAGERDNFKNYRDKNGDGKLDKSEIEGWMWPQDYDNAGVEADHLLEMADDNKYDYAGVEADDLLEMADDKDRKLTFDEILTHYDAFVGSQATQYGEHLKKHDPSEL